MLEPGQLVLPGPTAGYVAKSSGYTVVATDRGYLIDCTGSFTLTLTAAATLGSGFSFYVRNVSGTQVIDPNASETINGASTYTITNAKDVVLVVCDGSNWVLTHAQLPASVAITGGAIDGVTIGVTTPAAGNFTSIGNTTRGTIKGTTGDFNSTLGVTGVATHSSRTIMNGATDDTSTPLQVNSSGMAARFTNTTTTGSVYAVWSETNSAVTPAYLIKYGSTHATLANAFEMTSATGALRFLSNGTLALNVDTSQQVQVKATTTSSSTSTGALVVSGGIGVAGAGYFGGAAGTSAAGTVVIGGGQVDVGTAIGLRGAGSDTIASAPFLFWNTGAGAVAAVQLSASSHLDFWTNPGTWNRRMRMQSSGEVIIGTDPGGTDLFRIGGALTINSATLIQTKTAFTNGAAAATGTLTNAPAAGNPTKWIPINDNGTTRYIPAW